MEDLSKYTPIELNKMINDANVEHERIKEVIINHTFEIDELEIKINAKIEELTSVEKKYVELIEELNNRENGI
jgi:hypothetical protein